MSDIILTNGPEISLDVSERFVYNFYEENETFTNDKEIINNNNDSYKSINLSIKTFASYDKRVFTFLDNVNLDYISDFDNTNISNNDLLYFNKIHLQDKSIKNINIDKSDDEVLKINSYFNIDKNIHSSAINFIKSNKKISVSNGFYNEFIKNSKNSIFFTKDNISSFDDYEKILEKDISDQEKQKSRFEALLLNKGYNTFQKVSAHTNSVSIDSYYLNVGFLIEKYEIEGNTNTKVSSYFNYNKKNNEIVNLNRDRSHTISYNFNINDIAVQYGKTYKYIIYPVYITSLPTRSDYHTYDQILVCGYPYFTKEITCKEAKRPIPPGQLFFKYIKSKKELTINWSRPLEEQGDIKGYQVFKRYSLDDPFVLIKQIEFHSKNDFYQRNSNISDSIVENFNNVDIAQAMDKDFRPDSLQIYCICSIDAHGFISNYSAQYGVKYDLNNKKCIIDLVSNAGAPLHMPNLLIPRKTKFFDNDDSIITNTPVEEKVSKFSLYITPEFNSINANAGINDLLLKDSYKLSIFKLENADVHIDNISIKNFNN